MDIFIFICLGFGGVLFYGFGYFAYLIPFILLLPLKFLSHRQGLFRTLLGVQIVGIVICTLVTINGFRANDVGDAYIGITLFGGYVITVILLYLIIFVSLGIRSITRPKAEHDT